ncbi:DUF4921 family protein [bacterium]|nr:DUF4921 family protein [bacterium]
MPSDIPREFFQDLPPVSELRRDIVTGEYAIVSTARAERPMAPPPPSMRNDVERRLNCPFCPGHESMTPPETDAIRESGAPDAPGWVARVFPNKYPALRMGAESVGNGRDELHRTRAAYGAHEVLVETPEHDLIFPRFPIETMTRMFSMYRRRMRAIMADEIVAMVQIFKNHGDLAGASQPHEHSQIVGLPIVPPRVRNLISVAGAYHETHGRCVTCDVIADELATGARLVEQNDAAVALIPFAARSALETWFVPRRHGADFRDATDDEIAGVAHLLKAQLTRVARILPRLACNVVLSTAPRGEDGRALHWRVELHPRTGTAAGFEQGTGIHINPMPPEVSARRLRELVSGEGG